MSVSRSLRSLRPSPPHHGVSCASAGRKASVFLASRRGGSSRKRRPAFQKLQETTFGGQNCPSAEEDCLDWRLFERGCLSARHRKGSRCVASRGPRRKTQEYRLRSRGFGRLCAPIVCR